MSDLDRAEKVIKIAKLIQTANQREWERLEKKERELEIKDKKLESLRVVLESAKRELNIK